MEQEPIETSVAGSDKETNTWAMVLHLSVLASFLLPLAGVVAPIVIYLIKKDSLPGLKPHAFVVFNWLISALIYAVASLILIATVIFALIGIPGMIAVAALSIIFPIIGGIKASDGEVWPYPLSIKFFK